MNRIRLLLGLLAAAALVAGWYLRSPSSAKERPALAEAAPGASFSEKSGSPPLYRSPEGLVAFNSHDIAPKVRGYAGPIKVLIVLGPDGVIRGLKLIEHHETRSYVHYLETPAYLGRFVGKSVFDRFEIDKDLDGISRATVSVEALAETVRSSSRLVAAGVFGIEVPDREGRAGGGWDWLPAVAMLCAAGVGYRLTRRKRNNRRVRDGILIAAVIIIGFALSAPFSIVHIYNLLLFRVALSPLWIVMTGGALLSLALTGRAYCGWLCPFGALSEFIGRLRFRKWAVDPVREERGRKVKYQLLGVGACTALATGMAEYGNYETYVTLFSLHGSTISWALAVLALAMNIRIPRFWCRYLCPLAAFFGLFSRTAPGYPGGPDCPMGNGPSPQGAECIRCNRCWTGARERRPDNSGPQLVQQQG